MRAIYYTAYAASQGNKIDRLISLAKNTEINSVIIDVKEVDGKVAYDMSKFNFDELKPTSYNQFDNIKDIIKKLHKNNIYVIGRIVVFKDQLLAKHHPELTIKKKDKKTIWTDRNRKKYIDPSSKKV
jgi:hypothetical protein